jgi:hypothetical protein
VQVEKGSWGKFDLISLAQPCIIYICHAAPVLLQSFFAIRYCTTNTLEINANKGEHLRRRPEHEQLHLGHLQHPRAMVLSRCLRNSASAEQRYWHPQ